MDTQETTQRLEDFSPTTLVTLSRNHGGCICRICELAKDVRACEACDAQCDREDMHTGVNEAGEVVGYWCDACWSAGRPY